MPERTGPMETPGSMTMDALDVQAPCTARFEQPQTRRATAASKVIMWISRLRVLMYVFDCTDGQSSRTTMMRNDAPQARREEDAGLVTELQSRRCMEEPGWAYVSLFLLMLPTICQATG